MSQACTPILVGVASFVLGILVPSKTAKFPFQTMDYSPWSSKNLLYRNRLKKFMLVGIDVTCMHINFGGHGFSSFGDNLALKTTKFPFWTMDYSPWSSKNLMDYNRLKKFMQVGVVIIIHAHRFWQAWPLWFRRYYHFQILAKFSFWTMTSLFSEILLLLVCL